MEKSKAVKPKRKKAYWGLTQDGVSLFEGSFNECWQAMINGYGAWPLKKLADKGIKIQRIG